MSSFGLTLLEESFHCGEDAIRRDEGDTPHQDGEGAGEESDIRLAGYSARSATAGSARLAWTAGTQAAATPVRASTIGTATNVAGSAGAT